MVQCSYFGKIMKQKTTDQNFSEGVVNAVMSALSLNGQKKNATKYPDIYYARHMRIGLAGYEQETILVDHDCMISMMPSFQGKPVYVLHVDEVDLENIQAQADGYVVETFYNQLDGWVWSKIIIVSDEGHKKIADGWSVSNAYIPTKWGKGGTFNNCPYDREIMGGEYTHLAIVPNPRYESACVMSQEEYKSYCSDKREYENQLLNSKEQKKGSVMKFWKNEKKEVSEVDADTMVTITNDDGTTQDVKVQDMISAVQNAADEEKQKANMDEMIKVGNEEMTIKELSNRYQKLSSKKNEDDEEKSNESDDDEKSNEDDEKCNESDKDDEKENESDDKKDEKKNSVEKDKKNFDQLKNAGGDESGASTHMMRSDRIALGKERY